VQGDNEHRFGDALERQTGLTGLSLHPKQAQSEEPGGNTGLFVWCVRPLPDWLIQANAAEAERKKE
jgi:hypothetical protein